MSCPCCRAGLCEHGLAAQSRSRRQRRSHGVDEHSVFGLLPNTTARKCEPRTPVKAVELRNYNTVLKNILAHDLDGFVHTIKLHEPATLVVIQSHARSRLFLRTVL